MSAWLEAAILGLIQGLTEFLPVSSSGHLELAKYFFGDDRFQEQSMYMSIVLHFATALSTVLFFRKEVASLFDVRHQHNRKYILIILVSMIPAGLIGLFFDDVITSIFSSSIILIAAMLCVTGVLLWIADKAKADGNPLTLSSGFLIGLAQAFALIPGVSRSGSTIATSVLLGIERESAARFSFLMVVPLILGKLCKDLLDGTAADMVSQNLGYYVIGFIAAFISGLLACGFMVSLVKKAKLRYFTFYCFTIAIFAIIFHTFRF